MDLWIALLLSDRIIMTTRRYQMKKCFQGCFRYMSDCFSRMSPLGNLLSPSKHSTQSNVNVKHIPYSWYPE